MTRALALLGLLALGCTSLPAPNDLGIPDLAVREPVITATDHDGDGIADADEDRIAKTYLPFLSLSPQDPCPTSGLAVRVTPAEDGTHVRVRYAWVFDRACAPVEVEGGGGSFSLVVDPAQPAPAGIISMRAVARAETSCQRISTCGACDGQSVCMTSGASPLPGVWAGEGTHALYVDRAQTCTQVTNCASSCVDAPTAAVPPIVNVGEPTVPLVRDLTDEGFVRPELGWKSASLLHYDPWGTASFGSIVPIAKLLTASVDDPPTCSR